MKKKANRNTQRQLQPRLLTLAFSVIVDLSNIKDMLFILTSSLYRKRQQFRLHFYVGVKMVKVEKKVLLRL